MPICVSGSLDYPQPPEYTSNGRVRAPVNSCRRLAAQTPTEHRSTSHQETESFSSPQIPRVHLVDFRTTSKKVWTLNFGHIKRWLIWQLKSNWFEHLPCWGCLANRLYLIRPCLTSEIHFPLMTGISFFRFDATKYTEHTQRRKGSEGAREAGEDLQVCKHSVTVVASIRYPSHRRHVMWALMWHSFIFLVSMSGFWGGRKKPNLRGRTFAPMWPHDPPKRFE